MKTYKTSRLFVCAVFASVLAMAGLTACASGDGASGDPNAVAATIGEDEIKETTITDYIQNFRVGQKIESDEAFGTWLNQYGMTPSDMREDVINFFVEQELVKKAAEEKGVTVSDDDINAEVDQMKANYESDEAWQTALQEAGYTEDDYRENVRTGMLQNALQEKIIEENTAELTDEDLLEEASQYAPYFDGAKKSSHILFNADDEKTAQEVLDRINNGEIEFADAAKEYSQDTGSAENGGDVGWDMLNTFVTEYTDAVDGLNEGETSGLVKSDYGIHIIRCTEVFTAPDPITSLDQLPSELVDYIRNMANSSKESEAYSTWFEEYKEAADVQINEMPAGLPYDIDESLYKTSSEGSEGAEGVDQLGLDGELTSSEIQEIEEAQAEAAAADAAGEEIATEEDLEATSETSETTSSEGE